MPHFRIDELPSRGAELQTEYFVPRQHAVAALRAVTALHEQIAPLLMISEVRTIAADNLWMSPCYQQACVAIHFTWKLNWEGVRQLLPEIEAQLAPFEPARTGASCFPWRWRGCTRCIRSCRISNGC